MSEFFKVVPIESKGLGCIAFVDIKKGTTILKEKPQLPSPSVEKDHPDHKRDLFNSFSLMTNEDKEAFLKLSMAGAIK